jgi:hypothetical protein
MSLINSYPGLFPVSLEVWRLIAKEGASFISWQYLEAKL